MHPRGKVRTTGTRRHWHNTPSRATGKGYWHPGHGMRQRPPRHVMRRQRARYETGHGIRCYRAKTARARHPHAYGRPDTGKAGTVYARTTGKADRNGDGMKKAYWQTVPGTMGTIKYRADLIQPPRVHRLTRSERKAIFEKMSETERALYNARILAGLYE